MYDHLTVGVVIPCYKVAETVLDVIARVPGEVDHIFCIDDACPDGTADIIESRCRDPRVKVIRHEKNRGVGGAVKSGYRAAHAQGCHVAVKIDGDGQMDPRLIPGFLKPIAAGQADYTKGNRFFRVEDVRSMPGLRLFGNAVLSFMSKLSTGYWNLFDPTNGYTALHLSLLDLLPLDNVAERYFFETDMLFRLNVARAVVRDVPMVAVYGNERSNLRISRVFAPFLLGHIRNFHAASLEFLLGPASLAIGTGFAGYHWWRSAALGEVATAGTVMVGGLLIIVGMQLTLAALNFDVANVPVQPLHPMLEEAREETSRT
jgi:dolichol-phosphate mannosyltransferase